MDLHPSGVSLRRKPTNSMNNRTKIHLPVHSVTLYSKASGTTASASLLRTFQTAHHKIVICMSCNGYES